MAYRKFKADKLFDGYMMRDHSQILILNEEGIVENIVDESEAGDDIQIMKGILSPGFINCHCHLELSHMKGRVPEKTGLTKFVLQVVQDRHLPEDQILSAIADAEQEMLDAGIVAVGDICNNTYTIPQKSKGQIFYHNFIEASGYNPLIATQRFQHSLAFFNEYAKYYSIPIESNSIVPHAPYSVSDQLWEYIIHFPGNHLFTMHNQETIAENEWFMSKTGEFTDLYSNMKIDTDFFKASGKTSLQTCLSKFLNNQQVILVHNVHTSNEDIIYSQSAEVKCKVFWCFCPNANEYISGTIPDINVFQKNGCNIVFGTDSLASNHQLSILEEIRTIKKHFPNTDDAELLKWATINGARALQLDSMLGSFERGKQPGVLVIEKNLANVKIVN